MRYEDGTPLPRTMGIPQGAVLSPSLLNIYLKTLDAALNKNMHALGCAYYRYADDMLLLGPTQEALEKASLILGREVERVCLRLKEGTKTCDLKNPQNGVEWLGIEFTHGRARVPRARIEKKATDLLLRVRRGQVDLQGVEASLEHTRKHYERIVGYDRAKKAVESIRKLLKPFLKEHSGKERRHRAHHQAVTLARAGRLDS